MSRQSLSVVSLFTGAGGLDLGFEAAGYTTRVAVEMDKEAVVTLRSNRDWPVIEANIHSDDASSDAILSTAQLRPGQPDILIGGPPCQPFSKSGYWATGDAKRLADPRAGTLGAYLRVLREIQPRAFLLENVPGLAYNSKDEGIVFLRRSIEEINASCGTNYSFSSSLLRATEYGIPQERQRVFIVGHREGKQFAFRPPTHYVRGLGDKAVMRDGLLPCPNAWDAIGRYESDGDPSLAMSGKWADLLPTIPEGQNYLFHTTRGGGYHLFGWRTRYWSFLLKLAKHLPSWTIAAQPGPAIGPFHWRNRRLSARELGALQTFPKDYTIVGNLRSAQRQLGNAVPSALAERIALDIRAQFFGAHDADRDLVLLPSLRRNVPPAEEPMKALPSKYAELIGSYDDHPGTGQGPGALARRSS